MSHARPAEQAAFEFETIGASDAPPPPPPPERGAGAAAASAHARDSGAGGVPRTDSPLDGTVSGQTDLMAYPFFGLSKTPSRQEIRFEEGGVRVEVRPSGRGVATIYDKEILIYLASLAIERMSRGEEFSGVLTFTAYDFFKLAGLSAASGKNYQRLTGALERLQGTQIRTTIETGGVTVEGWFSWISEAQLIVSRNAKGEKRARAIRVRITDWLVRAIVADGSVLSYDRAYFGLNAIERRLYEIARAGCAGRAGTDGFCLDLATLRDRVGVTSPLKKFRQLLAQIIARDELPGYSVRFEGPLRERRPLARLRVRLAPRAAALAGADAETARTAGAAADAASAPPRAGEAPMS
ncbi:MAG: RepA family protein [Alphaproteobacteria bacterium]|nr:MAG: RepA family protein [Alphaproteobacteria bacterium]